MSRTPVFIFVLASVATLALSGCHRNYRKFGPPPPAYACDGYGYDGYDVYGGCSGCVDDGQYYDAPRGLRGLRERRRDRLSSRRGRRGATLNGLPVVAAYIMPVEMMGDCCGCDCDGCGMGCCGCDSCCPCDAGCPYGGCPSASPCPCGEQPYQQYGPNGSAWNPGHEPYAAPHPSEAYPYSGPGQGNMISPVPAPGVQEGPWNPPIESVPRTTPEPEASRPVQSATWVPARLQ